MVEHNTAESVADKRMDLVGMDRTDLEAVAEALGEPSYRGRQIYQWIYQRGVTDFTDMLNLSKAARARLAEKYRIGRPTVQTAQLSTDGTRKWLLGFIDGNEAETVFIPEAPRGTLCVSSQIGCTLTCAFCHTGTQRLVRNLEPSEIVGQIMLARDALDAWPAAVINRPLTNIVMMGMGEPLYNFENVKKALSIVVDDEGLAMSRRRITLSTSGLVPEIRRCGHEIGCMLAISLHAVRDEVRDMLVPINRKWPIKDLMEACRDYSTLSNARRITFEYVMLKGVNDSLADARELARLMSDIPSKVNLIPFNPWPGSAFECSSNSAIDRFAKLLREAGCVATVRSPRGQDIMAACGQLKSESVRQRRSVVAE
jgi:23S rRNA (adenine2503-C2)-methyltransferase